mmetsp:Transcript_52891/g.123796  ORF Transcript_52891/g.123796 Transcript_52891/m.123796 type:complete len:113 (-) Transcript_52891:69-407(-)
MAFACRTMRFARCRAAQLSPWARQVNWGLDAGRRQVSAAAAVVRLGEVCPNGVFPEKLSCMVECAQAQSNLSEGSEPTISSVESLIEAALIERCSEELEQIICQCDRVDCSH